MKYLPSENPLVSIQMITYNHEDYIAQAIEGVLMQKTSFKIELVIGEDCSTDSTREICEEYVRKYPTIIRLLPSQSNIGIIQNGIRTLESCRGKYIALCEGDDYWTDPYKLQNQIGFLAENPLYVMSFHKIDFLVGGEQIKGNYYPLPPKSTLNIHDIILRHYIPTCSLVFKKDCLPKQFPEWFFKSRIGDIPIEILLASKGLTYYHNESMGCYRKNKTSITHNKEQKIQGRKTYLFVYKNLNKTFQYKYWLLFYYKIILLRLGYIKDALGLNESLN